MENADLYKGNRLSSGASEQLLIDIKVVRRARRVVARSFENGFQRFTIHCAFPSLQGLSSPRPTFPDELWNELNDSRRRGPPVAADRLRGAAGAPAVPNEVRSGDLATLAPRCIPPVVMMRRAIRAIQVLRWACLRSVAGFPGTIASASPPLPSGTLRLVSDQSLIGSGVASVRRKLARL